MLEFTSDGAAEIELRHSGVKTVKVDRALVQSRLKTIADHEYLRDSL